MTHRPLEARFSGRLWENGEFGFSRVRELTPESYRLTPNYSDYNSWVDKSGKRHICDWHSGSEARRGASPLGSSHHVNSHRNPTKARRGLKGISSHGRKLVRNGCYRLRSHVRSKTLTLLTMTVPGCSDEQLRSIVERWSELLRIFQQRLRRRLRSEGLPGEIVGVSEVQEKRAERSGLPVLHFHWVFVGRKVGKAWCVKASEVRCWWRELLSPLLPDCTHWDSLERIETVKKNVENYLGKYMSKGVGSVQKLVNAGQECYLPSSWYICSNSMRKAVKSAVRTGFAVGDFCVQMCETGGRSVFKYVYDVKIGSEVEGQVCIGKHGRFIDAVYCQYLTFANSCDKVADECKAE